MQGDTEQPAGELWAKRCRAEASGDRREVGAAREAAAAAMKTAAAEAEASEALLHK